MSSWMIFRKWFVCFFLCLLIVAAPVALRADDASLATGHNTLNPNNAAESSISINGDVSEFAGNAVANLAIKVPSGRNKLEPKIALNYNSSAGNGRVGLGWTLEMGAIERSSKFGINYSLNNFVFKDGSDTREMMSLGSNAYSVKIEENFLKFYWSGSGGWTVTDKDGTVYYYGTTTASQQTNAQGNVYRWCLDKIQDTNGNYILFGYTKDQNELYLIAIKYTGNVQGLSPSNTVNFYYETRPDAVKYAISPDMVSMRFRLKTISILAYNSQQVRAYKFEYTQADTTSISMLTKVQEFGSDAQVNSSGDITNAATASSFPPVTFTMSNDPVSVANGVRSTVTAVGSTERIESSYYVVKGDLTGDLKPDVALISPFVGQQYNTFPIQSTQFSFLTQYDGSYVRYANFPYVFSPCMIDSRCNLSLSYAVDPAYWPTVRGDFDGDGKMDFMFIQAQTNTVFPFFSKGDGTFVPMPSSSDHMNYSSDTFPKDDTFLFTTGDFNGDGKSDYIVLRPMKGQSFVYTSNGNGSFTARPPTIDWVNYHGYKLVMGDFNGDGKTDYMWIGADFSNNTTHVFLSDGDGTFKIIRNASNGVNYRVNGLNTGFATGDFNGDGKTDYVLAVPIVVNNYRVDYTWYVFLSNGDGTFSAPINSSGTTGGNFSFTYGSCPYQYGLLIDDGSLPMGGGILKAGDFNGDGKTDLILAASGLFQDSTGNFVCPSVTYLMLSKGDGTFSSPQVTENDHNLIAGTALEVDDFNADGKSDYAWFQTNLAFFGRTVFSATPPQPIYKLIALANGKGGTVEFTYKPSSTYTNTFLPFVIQVVDTIIKKDGLGNQAKASYLYAYGLYDYPTREFRGFGYVQAKRPDGTIVKTYYNQDYYLKGKAYQSTLNSPSGTILTKTEKAWETELLYDNGSSQRKFVKLSQERTEYYDSLTVSKQTNYTYDSTNGNLLTSVATGTDAEKVTTSYEYANYGTWLWKQTKSTITGSTTGKVRQMTNGYEATTGNLLWAENWNNNGDSPKVTLTYYTNGNLWTATDALGYTTTIEYETATGTYPCKITRPSTNGVAHVTCYTNYDYRVGKPQSIKDENGQITACSFDTLGRLSSVSYPDGGQTTTSYYDFAFPQYTVSMTKVDAIGNMIAGYNYTDGFGRPIQKITFGENGKSIVIKTIYDEMGRVSLTQGPFFVTIGVGLFNAPNSPYPWTQTTYDYRSRVTKVTSPHVEYGNISTSYGYAGFSVTTTDPDGKQKTEKKDYRDRILQVTELADGGQNYITKYTYNASGDMLTITDHNSNVTTINYDSLGRKINMTDPDRGTWYYTYDKKNNLLTQKDAKSQTLTFTYDELSRVKTKTYPANISAVTYTYDSTAITNGIGRLYSVTNGKVKTTITGYDVMGRTQGETKTITGAGSTGRNNGGNKNDTAYTTTYSYDYLGRQTGLTYPDGTRVAYYFYPGSSLIKNIVNVSKNINYALYSNYEPTGKIGQINYGNGTATRYTYDPLSTKLYGLVTAAPGGLSADDLQRKSYKYTAAGDIRQITDEIKNITYTYTYDNLHRLISETNNTGAYASHTYAYDAIGNITSKQLGSKTYTYAYAGTQKHAVSSIAYNNVTYHSTYDANGNMLTGPDFTDTSSTGTRTITYDPDNMPGRVVHSTRGTTDFIYDHAGRRAKKATSSSTTYYIHPQYEITDGVVKKYIVAADTKIAIIKGSEISYFHQDHLKSSSVMTNVSGAKVEATEYDPYGTMRDRTGTVVTNYRYTGKELDTESNLYYYGARYYDPMIGRFITPDPILGLYIRSGRIYKPVNLNLYHYAADNPLIYVDLDGLAFTPIHAITEFTVSLVMGEGFSKALYNAHKTYEFDNDATKPDAAIQAGHSCLGVDEKGNPVTQTEMIGMRDIITKGLLENKENVGQLAHVFTDQYSLAHLLANNWTTPEGKIAHVVLEIIGTITGFDLVAGIVGSVIAHDKSKGDKNNDKQNKDTQQSKPGVDAPVNSPGADVSSPDGNKSAPSDATQSEDSESGS